MYAAPASLDIGRARARSADRRSGDTAAPDQDSRPDRARPGSAPAPCGCMPDRTATRCAARGTSRRCRSMRSDDDAGTARGTSSPRSSATGCRWCVPDARSCRRASSPQNDRPYHRQPLDVTALDRIQDIECARSDQPRRCAARPRSTSRRHRPSSSMLNSVHFHRAKRHVLSH